MKLLKVAIWCIGLLTLAFYGMGRSQKPVLPPSNIVQQALRFTEGHPLAFQGKAKIAWQECYIFSGDIGSIYVDTLTGQVTAAFYKLSMTRREQITQEKAEREVKSWLMERGITLSGWILEERRVYDRGSAGKEYVFRWVKRSPEGIYLPCILKVVVGEDGAIRYFWRVERETEIPLKPLVNTEKAIEIAMQAAKLAQGRVRVTRRHLRVWFNEKGQQCLWWEITLQGDDLQRKVILNAYTGELVAVLQPLGVMQLSREEAEKKATEFLKDLKQIDKVEIIGYGPRIGIPLASPTKRAGAVTVKVIKNRQILQSLLSEIETMVKQPKPFAALVASPFWLRLHLQGGRWIYHCKFSPKDGYFEVYTKEPWPQKLEGKVVKIIRAKDTTIYVHDWPPERVRRIGISCRTTCKFKDIIMNMFKK